MKEPRKITPIRKRKQQVNIRASDLTISQLEDLMRWWGASQTEALTVAIDRIHRQEAEKRVETSDSDLEDIAKL